MSTSLTSGCERISAPSAPPRWPRAYVGARRAAQPAQQCRAAQPVDFLDDAPLGKIGCEDAHVPSASIQIPPRPTSSTGPQPGSRRAGRHLDAAGAVFHQDSFEYSPGLARATLS
jgi:hypothetical protein